jgi:hypothetical protein
VHLSRVLDNSFRENPAVLLSPEATFALKERKVWISVGTLPLLSIGDIWRDDQLEMRPDYEFEHFPDLEINSGTAVLIKAGLNLEERGFLLPLSEHPWHRQCTQSYCLMVELPHNRRLIIPCMELIRFYFGSSSNLLTKLFLPPLSRDALYSKPHFDKATGRLTLQLPAGISGVSSVDIGRLTGRFSFAQYDALLLRSLEQNHRGGNGKPAGAGIKKSDGARAREQRADGISVQ